MVASVLWTGNFDRSADDPFTLYKEPITQETCGAVEVRKRMQAMLTCAY